MGKRVTAPQIARAEKAHPQTRKGRWKRSSKSDLKGKLTVAEAA
jgi:hypothetical protein